MGIAPNDHDVLTDLGNGSDSLTTANEELAPSLRVVTAIAKATGDDPATMAPLFRSIDTDALDNLLDADTQLEVVFEYQGRAIEVSTDGYVSVDGREYEVL